MPPCWPMYLFLGLSNCSFESYFQRNFGQGWANSFKLVSAQPSLQPKKKVIVTELFQLVSAQPSLQPKKKVIVTEFKFVVLKMPYFFDMRLCLNELQKENCVKIKLIAPAWKWLTLISWCQTKPWHPNTKQFRPRARFQYKVTKIYEYYIK